MIEIIKQMCPEDRYWLKCPYAGVYTENEFAATKMSCPGGNFGAFCRELIMVHREEFGPQDRDGWGRTLRSCCWERP